MGETLALHSQSIVLTVSFRVLRHNYNNATITTMASLFTVRIHCLRSLFALGEIERRRSLSTGMILGRDNVFGIHYTKLYTQLCWMRKYEILYFSVLPPTL